MSKGREIRCYDYVNHPFARVRDALSKDAPRLFQSATKAAASRAHSVASELHVDLGGIGVRVSVTHTRRRSPNPYGSFYKVVS